MKIKYFSTLIIAVAILIFTSCENFLDLSPKSSFSADAFYKTTSDAEAGVIGIYDAAQSAFKLNFCYWGEGRADNVQTTQSGEGLYLIQNNLNESISSASWSALYTMISRANYAIKYIPEIFESDDEDGLQLIGQAKALRALAYFYLVRVWGDVPLITEPCTSVDNSIFVTKTDQEEVLDQIEEDLNYAATYCVDKFNSDDDRIMVNKGSANGLLTQVYMWRHKYEEALESSELVMNNSLYSLVTTMDDWGAIFSESYSDESIFEVAYSSTETNGLRTLYAIGSYSIYTPSEIFKASFESGDLRQEYVYDVTLSDPKAIWKYLGKGVSDEVSTASLQNIVLIRLADIMLLRAEALVNIGGTDNITEALSLLNTIRSRAGLSTFATEVDAITMYSDLESAILHERSIELCYEGHRWFDLVRTGRAIDVMGPINGLSDEGNLVWPISESSLEKNPNLLQNPFYE